MPSKSGVKVAYAILELKACGQMSLNHHVAKRALPSTTRRAQHLMTQRAGPTRKGPATKPHLLVVVRAYSQQKLRIAVDRFTCSLGWLNTRTCSVHQFVYFARQPGCLRGQHALGAPFHQHSVPEISMCDLVIQDQGPSRLAEGHSGMVL